MKVRLMFCTLIFAILFSYSFSSVMAYEPLPKFKNFTVKVGTQPMAIFPTGGDGDNEFNVICLGMDQDYNGVIDEGDEAMSWWKVSNVSNALDPNSTEDFVVEKVKDFGIVGSNNFPYRCYTYKDHIYVCCPDYVLQFDKHTTECTDTIMVAGAKSITPNGDGSVLYVSVRELENPGDYFPKDNYIAVYDVANRTVKEKLQTGSMVQKTIFYRNDNTMYNMLAVLCEGSSNDSQLQFFNLTLGTLEKTIEIGNLGNDIQLIEVNPYAGISLQFIAVVVNGEHKVLFVDPNTMSLELNPILAAMGFNSTLELPTTGYNGPRELSYSDEVKTALITAYDGNIYAYDVLKNKIDVIPTAGTPESVYIPENKVSPDLEFAYTLIYKTPGTYEANNEVVFVTIDPNSSVAEAGNNNYFISPNPVISNAKAYLPNNFGNTVKAEIFDVTGNKVQTIENLNMSDNAEVNFNLNTNLPKGVYYINFNSNDKNVKMKFVKD